MKTLTISESQAKTLQMVLVKICTQVKPQANENYAGNVKFDLTEAEASNLMFLNFVISERNYCKG